MEISQKQLEANQENALKGGVKTDEGKNISKYNAIKHGILKETISDYEQDFYTEVIEKLEEDYQPVGAMEEIIIERVAIQHLRLHRVARAEKEYIKSTLNPRRTKIVNIFDDDIPDIKEVVINEGYVPKIGSFAIQNLFEIYQRYEITIENRLYKALHELQRLQAIRKGYNPPLSLSLDINLDKSE